MLQLCWWLLKACSVTLYLPFYCATPNLSGIFGKKKHATCVHIKYIILWLKDLFTEAIHGFGLAIVLAFFNHVFYFQAKPKLNQLKKYGNPKTRAVLHEQNIQLFGRQILEVSKILYWCLTLCHTLIIINNIRECQPEAYWLLEQNFISREVAWSSGQGAGLVIKRLQV